MRGRAVPKEAAQRGGGRGAAQAAGRQDVSGQSPALRLLQVWQPGAAVRPRTQRCPRCRRGTCNVTLVPRPQRCACCRRRDGLRKPPLRLARLSAAHACVWRRYQAVELHGRGLFRCCEAFSKERVELCWQDQLVLYLFDARGSQAPHVCRPCGNLSTGLGGQHEQRKTRAPEAYTGGP